MRIFVAGATGVIGIRLVPLLVEAGHTVAPELGGRNDRMRREGTCNLLAAAHRASARRIYAQSIAWQLPPDRAVTMREHERGIVEVVE